MMVSTYGSLIWVQCLQLLAELEPRRQREDRVETLVNLGATLEDHGEVLLVSLPLLPHLINLFIS